MCGRVGIRAANPGQEIPLDLGTGKDCLEFSGSLETLYTAALGCGEATWLRLPVLLGVWPDGSDGTDINSLCRSHNERVVAVADDFCKVHLFQYPCARAKVRS